MEITPALVKAHNIAKIGLMRKPDSSFFTTVCFSLKHIWDDEIPTACTDGVSIRFNPSFFQKLSVEEQIFLMLHETMHVALLHMIRFKQLVNVSPQKFNIAADHVINLALIDRGYRMPEGGHADPIYRGLSVEDVIKLLPEPPPNTDCDLREPDGDMPTQQAAVEEILVRASIQSKLDNDKPGTIPGEVEIFLNKLLNPKLPWNRILQKYLMAKNKNDYSFKRFNRRFLPDFYLPSLYSDSLMDMTVAVDTSGSVSDEDFTAFISETSSIMKMQKPAKLTMVQFDTQIKSVDPIRSVRELSKVKFFGKGGTNVTPLFNWANTTKTQALLVFTDGFFPPSTEKPNCDVIWLIHNNLKFKSEFGKIIHYTLE